MRLGCDVSLDEGRVSTLRVDDRTLFARIVESLLSEQGEYAKEPYLLLDDDGKAMTPRRRMMVVNTLPTVPLDNRTLIGKLYKRVGELSEADAELHEAIAVLSAKLRDEIESAAGFLRGEYFLSEWDLEAYLKAYSLSPPASEGFSLLDNCMHFFELVSDVAPDMPVVMVNAKLFFEPDGLEELLGRAVFSGIRLLLLETSKDVIVTGQEFLTTVDQQFLVE